MLFTALLPHGWRAVADLDQLTSLTFRLAWSETFAQAVNSEVRNTAFLTNNFQRLQPEFCGIELPELPVRDAPDFDHIAKRPGSAL